MTKYSKAEAIKIVISCARQYEMNLLDKTLLFVLMDKYKKLSSVEVTFYRQNFLHLTGLKINKINMSAEQFFQNCIDKRLSADDFCFAGDGSTNLKLQILPVLMSKNLNANSYGEFTGNGIQLYTENLAGGVKGCIGFVKDALSLEFVPNTLLNEDIRKVSKGRKQIIVTYRKSRTEENFTEIVYKAKKVDWDKIQYPDELMGLPKP